jgi:hypothetical protein
MSTGEDFNEEQSRELREKAAALKSALAKEKTALAKSNEHRLEAAALIRWGFDNYKGPTLDRFLSLAGTTRGAANMYRRIGKCDDFYQPEVKEAVSPLGRSVLYEMQKLSDSPTRFQEAVAMAKRGDLTKAKLTQMVKEHKGVPSSRRIVIFSVEIDQTDVEELPLIDRQDLDLTCDKAEEIFRAAVISVKIKRQPIAKTENSVQRLLPYYPSRQGIAS